MSAKKRVRAEPDGTRRSARIQGKAPEHGETAAVVPTPEQREAAGRKKAKRVQASEDTRQARVAAAVVAQNATCSVCHSMHDPETILLCDSRGCQRGRHLLCCDPPLTRVPRGLWFCGCVVDALLAPMPEPNEERGPGLAILGERVQDDRLPAQARAERRATRLHTTRISAVAHDELDHDGYNAAERKAADEDLEASLQGRDFLDSSVQLDQTPGGAEAARSQNAACWRAYLRREQRRILAEIRREQEQLTPAPASASAPASEPAPALALSPVPVPTRESQAHGAAPSLGRTALGPATAIRPRPGPRRPLATQTGRRGPVSATLGENLLRMQQEPAVEENPEWSVPTTTLW